VIDRKLRKIPRQAPGSVQAHPDYFPPKDPADQTTINYLVDFNDPAQPVAFPGCFPWIPPGFNIFTDGCQMFPDREGVCRGNREIHKREGIECSVAEFFPQQALGGICGKRVVLLGSGPSLGTQRVELEKARADGAIVIAVNGAIQAVPNADIFFCLERCAIPEWWAAVDPKVTPIWTSPSARYEIATHWPKDRRFYFLHHWDVFDGWKDGPIDVLMKLPATLSCMVSTINCMQLIAWCQPKDICLLGQDFAGVASWNPATSSWGPGPYYWDGSFPKTLTGEIATLVEGRGGPCATSLRLVSMGEALELAGELIALNAEIPVYNVSRFGILDLPSCPEWDEKYRA